MTSRRLARPRRVVIFGDGARPRVRREADAVEAYLAPQVETVGRCLTRTGRIRAAETDLLVILGGDGAILAAAHRLAGQATPSIGIRLGHFGFLAELEPATWRDQFARIFAGRGRIVDRMMLRCEVVRAGRVVAADRALNDVVIGSGALSRMVVLDLAVDGQDVAMYRGDGLIIATPVGSTAHSLAAGGPVIEPDARSILVTPLASHALSTRPVVLDGERVLTLRVRPQRGRRTGVTLDGQRTIRLNSGDTLRVRRAPEPFRMATVVDRSFFETLRQKFTWSGSAALDLERGVNGKRP